MFKSIRSQLQTIWTILQHSFTAAETVEYPEQQPYLAPRYRGRIVLTRDPDGDEITFQPFLPLDSPATGDDVGSGDYTLQALDAFDVSLFEVAFQPGFRLFPDRTWRAACLWHPLL